ncbi:uncharacterized protein LOC111025412 [Momordica charantia]|uniref:Uncharacterized protein LOC111025412 n=1 Tax=Momordica charantia TaxID=3673 RepID=A0A6J1DXB1_MOMCH|nr:uncharacterized protein LOC111025412 [Momordica charantia]
MDFQAATDAIKCRAFQISLTGSARLWYRRLPARSISTYSQLRREFIAQFSSRNYDRKTATHLATIRQKEGETLRGYVTRFQEEQFKVAHYSDDSAMCYFLTGLTDEALTVKLGEEAPATFAESIEGRRTAPVGADLMSVTLITTILISEILTNIEESGMEKLLKRPEKLKEDPERRNKDKYCRFHREHGHNTSNCWELKRQIEDLIQDGYFKKFVGKPRSNSAVPSTLHQVLKYSTPNGVGTVRGEQKASRECYASALKGSLVCALEEHANGDELLKSEADLPRVGKREFSAPTEELELVPLLSPEK